MMPTTSGAGDGAIAVVGMACRFPGAADVDAFWSNLRDGVEAVRQFSREELLALGVSERELGRPGFVPAGAVLDGADRFDADFFRIIPRHAELLDPQQRLLLECAWEALEQSGHNPETLEGSAGVYLSVAKSAYPQGPLRSPVEQLVALAGEDKDYAAARVSYKLNLRGPSLMVQSASSSSLVAVHVACEALRNGECDVALVGGASVSFPQAGYVYDETLMFAPDGHCRAFDADAAGTVPGNGVGVVALKPLADALAAGNPIWAVIRGSAVNNDGADKVDFYAPSVEGQRRVVQEALALAGVEPRTVGYVEAHGTGTPLGDPLEVEALRQAFGPDLPPGSCAIGSVKTNLGHLHSAAGVAGLIKVVLMLHHRALVPSLHYRRPNSRIDFARLPFRVSTAHEPWPTADSPRRAGVSAFGFGGTNAHVVLEEPPAQRSSGSSSGWQLLPVSARTDGALDCACANLARHLREHPDVGLEDAAYTLQVGRKHFSRRRAILCRSREEAVAALEGRNVGDGTAPESLQALAHAWIQGSETGWQVLHNAETRRRVVLPTYPLERQSYWAVPVVEASPSPVGEACESPAYEKPSAESGLRSAVAKVLGKDPNSLDDERTFAELGIDSIVGPQLVLEIQRLLGIELAPTVFYQHPTVRQLAAHLAAEPLPLPGRQPQRAPVSECNDRAVAVIGMAGRFPGARNLREFWQNLAAGKDSVRPLPAGAWDDHATDGQFGAPLEDADCFDSRFFQIAPREAERIDPQQRLFLECAWHALEDAGYGPAQLRGRRVGVFVGAQPNDYARDAFGAHSTIGNSLAILASRIAYHLDLRGPSLAVDTACSSSLVAIHLACQSLWNGESEMALAGGVSCHLFSSRGHQFFQDAGMASPTGRCSAFGADADGFVPGEGVGAVVLKPLHAAIRDGDVIHGVIRGSGINQDGKSNGITAPNASAQAELERAVYEQFRLDPATFTYVEAHGTGTRLGDPIEVQALTEAFRRSTGRRQFCALGSVKTNIGHTLTAAGVAGFLKVLLALRHRQLPPSLHCGRPNELIPFADSPFYVNTQLQDWPAGAGHLRRAAVSAFGFGGTNAHVVLEEAPPHSHRAVKPGQPVFVAAISGQTAEALQQRLHDLLNWLRDEGRGADLGDVAYTLNVGRKHFAVRTLLVVRERQECMAQLERALAAGNAPPELPAELGAEWRSATSRYLRGEEVDWESCFRDWPYRRVPLPGYPFARERHWYRPTPAVRPASEFMAPAWTERTLQTNWTGEEWFWRDHVVRGRRLLPGVVYLELARAGIRAEGVCRVRDVAWERPLFIDEGDISVQLSLRQQGDAHWSIAAPSQADAPYCRGRWVSGPDLREPPAEVIPLDAVRGRCPAALAGEQLYQRLDQLGFAYGPGFRTVRHLWTGPRELLAELQVSETAALPPGDRTAALLEGALHSLLGLSPDAASGELPLPLGLGEIIWHRPLPPRCFVHAKSKGPREGRVAKYDLTLVDERGQAFVSLHGYAVSFASAATGGAERANTTAENCYYAPEWEPCILASAASPPPAGCSVLLVDEDWSRSVAARLRAAARPDAPVVVISSAAGFRECSPEHYEVNAGSEADYQAVFAALRRRGVAVARVVHFGTLPGDAAPVDPEQFQRHLLAYLACAKVLLSVDMPPAALWHVGGAASLLAGTARTLAQENPRLRTRTLDVPAHADAERIAAWLQAEWHADDHSTEVRYHDGARQVRRLRPIQPGAPLVELSKPGGVYLITGGAGGVGLQLAKLLASRAAQVLLTGRSPLTPDREQRIRAAGERLTYLRADVSSAGDVRRLFADIRARFGRLDGIVHAAGETHDAYVRQKDLATVPRVLAAKVAGTVLLDEYSRDFALDWFLLCSSAASAFGNPAQADYAAANGYLDGFAAWREKQRRRGLRAGKTVSLNWPPWQDAGLSVPAEVLQRLRQDIGLEPLPSAAAFEALRVALAHAGPQCVLLHGRRESLDRFVQGEPAAREPAPADSAGDLDQARRILRSLFATELKLPAEWLELREPMEAYGIDSVMIYQLNRALERQFGPLPKSLLFECLTLDDVAAYVAQHCAARLKPAESADNAVAPTPAPAEDKKTISPAARMPAQPAAGRTDVAIVGVSGRFPKANDLDQFWDNLRAGVDCVTEIPAARWAVDDTFYQPGTPASGKSYTKWGGFLEGVDQFDPLLFQIAPRDADLIDPQERLFLETAWTALESAGYAPRSLSDGGPVGVFVGVMYGDYGLLAEDEAVRGRYVAALAPYWSVANRVSFALNLHGPSLAVDTACSSSLTALHLACESLRRGECRVALAGGVNLSLHPNKYLGLSHARFASTDGRCRSFGAGATGYVPGEGVGAVVLKRLADAEADGDHVHAVIRATVINHGGKTTRYTAPNPRAQAELVAEALDRAGVSARSISYLEAHGTGTDLGDPVEVRGLTKAFAGADAGRPFCALGSVKSNIGHLEAASGIAAVAKVLLQLRHGLLAPTLHCEPVNPGIDFEQTPFILQRELAEWRRPVITENGRVTECPRRAGISSFGAGGANAHVILEEYLPPAREPGATTHPLLLVLSAQSEDCLRQYARLVRDFLDKQEDSESRLADVLFTLQVGREPMRWRLAIVARDRTAFVSRLDQFLTHAASADVHFGEAASAELHQAPPSDATRSLIQAGRWEELARGWVRGGAIDWLGLGWGEGRRRVPAPTYPFERKRYWLPQHKQSEPAWPGVLSPARGGGLLLRWTDADAVLRDHRVHGQPVFPAAGYLALVRAALEQAGQGRQVAGLQAVVWPQPLTATEPTGTLRIEWKPGAPNAAFTIASDGVQSRVHCQGQIIGAGPARSEVAAPRLELGAIRERCRRRTSVEELYADFQNRGVEYGPTFRLLGEFWVGEHEVLARIELPADVRADQTPLAPAILDAAWQAALPLYAKLPGGGMPFAVERVEWFGAIAGPCYAYVRTAGGEPRPEMVQFDVSLVAETGDVLIAISQLTVRTPPTRREAQNGRSPASAETPKPAVDAGPLIYLKPEWVGTTLPERGPNAPVRTRLVLRNQFGKELTAELRHAGGVREAVFGSEFRTLGPDRWEIDPRRAEHFERLLAEAGAVDEMVFLGGLHDARQAVGEVEQLHAVEEQGVLALLRLIRAWIAQARGQGVGLRVVTNGVHAIRAADQIQPWSAAALGLAQVAGRELSLLETSSLDLPALCKEPTAVAACCAWLQADRGKLPSRELAYRDGRWYERNLVRAELAPAEQVPLRKRGVYLIVGGLGGVGTAVARFLARSVQARLVIVGRSAESERREQLRALEQLGASVLYCQADVARPGELRAAVAAAKQRWGRLDGAIHSALRLADRSLPRMDDASFRAALDTKAAGAFALAHALEGEALDFLVFFSSANALEGNPGQANYVAGCVFKDAFAHYLRLQHNLPVKIINWGYWGEVGVTATPEIRERMARQGVGSIHEAEGVEAFCRVLAWPVPQIVPLKASRAMLERLRIDPDRVTVLAPAQPSVAAAVRERAGRQDRPPDEVQRLLAGFDAVDVLARRWLLAQLADMGLRPKLDTDAEGWRDCLGVAPRYQALLAALLAMLETDRALVCRDGRWSLAPETRIASPESLQAEQEQLLLREPRLAPYVELLGACLPHYAAILRGELDPVGVLFPQGSLRLAEGIYSGNVAVDYFNDLLAGCARAAVEQVAAERGGVVRVLEVGAGTGGATRLVLAGLRGLGRRVEYVFTDLSTGFLHHAERRFGREYPFLTTRLFDVEKDPAAQGLDAGSFDVVIAYNVIHATRRLHDTLRHCKQLLRTNGVLLLNELSRPTDFATITFGLTPGWWRFEDITDRLPHGPAASPGQWTRVLEELGYRNVSVHPRPESGVAATFQSVIVAESDGWIERPAVLPPAAEPQAPAERSPVPPGPGPADRQRRLEDRLVPLFAQVLKLEPGAMRADEPFDHYGLESLAVLDLTARLEKELGELPKTLLFEQNSVRRLASYLLENHGPAVDRWLAKTNERPVEPNANRSSPHAPKAATNGVHAARPTGDDEPFAVAIVGLSGRYPEAETLDEFWDNLKAGRNCIREIPPERWDYRRYFDAAGRDEFKSYTRFGGFLKDIDCFDAALFNISPREARAMDPQERLMLESAWAALEDAGYTPEGLSDRCRQRGGEVGVFAGVMYGAYHWLAVEEWARGRPTLAHSAYWSVANRVSFVFDFHGPSLAVDTACSSSLTALHLACESLRRGECKAALAGGVHLLLHPLHHVGLCQMRMVSAGPECRPFGAEADGFTSGEGVGVALLRPLADAVRDGDRIYAVIKGSMLNAGGRTTGYTVPSPQAQAEVVTAALRRAAIHPRTLSYVEAHGTGTALGDPIELRGLQQAFAPFTADRQFCALGSVKSGIGHLEAAAGIASVTKVVLQLQHRLLVPSLHAERPNPLIDLAGSPFRLQRDCAPWRRPTVTLDGRERTYPRRAGVSSFGAGGANVHLLLEEFGEAEPEPGKER